MPAAPADESEILRGGSAIGVRRVQREQAFHSASGQWRVVVCHMHGSDKVVMRANASGHRELVGTVSDAEGAARTGHELTWVGQATHSTQNCNSLGACCVLIATSPLSLESR